MHIIVSNTFMTPLSSYIMIQWDQKYWSQFAQFCCWCLYCLFVSNVLCAMTSNWTPCIGFDFPFVIIKVCRIHLKLFWFLFDLFCSFFCTYSLLLCTVNLMVVLSYSCNDSLNIEQVENKQTFRLHQMECFAFVAWQIHSISIGKIIVLSWKATVYSFVYTKRSQFFFK